jgi:hypothetical protein
MDTREKILPTSSLSQLLASGEWSVVAGVFDPLTVVQARRFAGLCKPSRKLLALVVESAETLLEANARAALIAGLREVDAVTVVAAEGWRSLIPRTPGIEIVEDEAGERARSDAFVRFVLRRQNA